MRKNGLLISLLSTMVVVLLSLDAPGLDRRTLGADSEFEIGITGMIDKKECVKKVTAALEAIKGVSAVSGSLSEAAARISPPGTESATSAPDSER